MELNELLWLRDHGMTVDLFAGGGGWSIGFEKAIKRPVDLALNHDPVAVAHHAMNHPRTRHLCQDIYAADPLEATRGQPVFWIHASPACTQFSRSRRALPAEMQMREMGWRVVEWVEKTRPAIVTMENVPEWLEWGPLRADGFPDKERRGETWAKFAEAFRDLGYEIEWRVINSAHHGAPTARERLIVIARRDGLEIEWPTPTHGFGKGLRPYQAAADHIRWDIPAPSIFTRRRELAEATKIRIAKGIRRFIVDDPNPFLAPEGTQVGDGGDRSDLVAAFLAQNHGLLSGRSLRDPASTICAKGAGQALVTASFMSIMRRNSVGSDLRDPVGTMCSSGGHYAEVRVKAQLTAAFLTAYFSSGGGQHHSAKGPVGTLTTKDRLALVTIHGVPHRIVDIGYRMLTCPELWSLQGFPPGIIQAPIINGKPATEEMQKRLIGNSVVPHVAEAVTAALLATIDRLRPQLKLAA